MFLAKLWRHVHPLTRLRENHVVTGLLSIDKLRAILERERNRTDRNGHEFSLIVFSSESIHGDSEYLRDLASALTRRARSTDQIGWFKRGQIGAVLPDTPVDGAWIFADDVCQGIAETAIPPTCAVYTYPSDWLQTGKQPYRQLRFSDIVPEFDMMRLPSSSSTIALQSGRGTMTLANGATSGMTAYFRAVNGMEPLFVRPMPFWKRAMDIIGSIVGLILFSPVMIVTAVAIKLTSKGPVIFKQPRAGLGGKAFSFYKFRSMYVGAEEMKDELLKYNEQTGPVFKMTNDPRITPVGRFIRKWSIDELPQLWNVLKGDMTLVGPRPPTFDEVPHYDRWQRRRLEVTPGLTCIWQVSGR